jgi:hypothetical protein
MDEDIYDFDLFDIIDEEEGHPFDLFDLDEKMLKLQDRSRTELLYNEDLKKILNGK